MSHLRRAAAVLSLAVVGGLLAGAPAESAPTTPPTAQRAVPAGTLTYVKSYDVWVAQADGSKPRRLTTDGTASSPWRSPTQSDAGIVVAGRGNLIYRMDQFGTVLDSLDPPDLPNSAGETMRGAPAHLAVSPDGSKIAYTYEKYSCPVGLACKIRYVTAFTSSTKVTPATTWGVTYYDNPSWITNTRVAVNDDLVANIRLFDLARGDQFWFDEGDYTSDDRPLTDFEVSRGGVYATAVRGTGDQTETAFFTVTGNFKTGGRPPVPTRICTTTEELGISTPTWSPDGELAAWQEPTGVWAVHMGDAPCDTDPYLMIAGARQPSYSVATMKTVRPTYSFRLVTKPRVTGTAKVGKKLTATCGTWSPSPASCRYLWLRNGKVVRGATVKTYAVKRADAGKRLSVRVTASRTSYRTTTASSAAVKVKR